MSIEIRIRSGALSGQARTFDQGVVLVGRQSGCDVRFDPEKDIDVSGRHAEIHSIAGRFALHDLNSTNGTYVNGTRLPSGGTHEIRNGDKIRFGASGPEVEFRVPGAGAAGVREPSTEVRIAMAVDKQTAGLRRMMVAGIALVVIAGGGYAWMNSRAATLRDREFQRLLQANDSMRAQLQSGLARTGDTTLVSAITGRIGTLRSRLEQATTDAQRADIRAEIEQTEQQLRRMVQMDLPTIFARNARGVAIMMSDIDGRFFTGSAFGITKEGLLVTNRHNVIDPNTGTRATRLAVKFTDTRDWLPAEIVTFSEDDDLALIRMTRRAEYPVVEGISRTTATASEGMSVAIIGYPAGTDTPMEGEGNDFMAKSTLSPGTVSKKTSSILQIDSFATHGSSGSPVFSSTGQVIGVVFGGNAEAGGKLVYAVPAERIAAFLPRQYSSVLKD